MADELMSKWTGSETRITQMQTQTPLLPSPAVTFCTPLHSLAAFASSSYAPPIRMLVVSLASHRLRVISS